jgi:uncharacterized protein (TIGR03086 family)
VIAGVRPAQYDDPTPCEEWNVRDLLSHMIGVVVGLGAAASGADPAGGDPFVLADDPAAQFSAAAEAAMGAWRTPGVMESMVNIRAGSMPGRMAASINLIDTATHTWDLAVATGQPAGLGDELAPAVLEVARATISSGLRAGRFGPELEAPADASATERLVAFLGRK